MQWLSGKLSQMPPTIGLSAQTTYDRRMRVGLSTAPPYSLTEAQQDLRDRYSQCARIWGLKTELEKEDYTEEAEERRLLEYNVLQSRCIPMDYTTRLCLYSVRPNWSYTLIGNYQLAMQIYTGAANGHSHVYINGGKARFYRIGEARTLEVAFKRFHPFYGPYGPDLAVGQRSSEEFTTLTLGEWYFTELSLVKRATAGIGFLIFRCPDADASNKIVIKAETRMPGQIPPYVYSTSNGGSSWQGLSMIRRNVELWGHTWV